MNTDVENPNLTVTEKTKKKTLKEKQNSTNSNESSDLSDDVFYTYSSNNQAETASVDEVVISKVDQKRPSSKRTKSARCRRKHDNLDTKSLTLLQRLRLAKVQYVNIPNLIRLFIIVVRYDDPV